MEKRKRKGGNMTLYQLFQRTLCAPYLQLKENAASYFAQREGDALYLFFEKSNGATDWKNNLDFPAKPYRDMEELWFVHRGFLRRRSRREKDRDLGVFPRRGARAFVP